MSRASDISVELNRRILLGFLSELGASVVIQARCWPQIVAAITAIALVDLVYAFIIVLEII